jgi:hypothetical protein
MLAVMEESRNKKHVEGGDREILYSKAIKTDLLSGCEEEFER